MASGLLLQAGNPANCILSDTVGASSVTEALGRPGPLGQPGYPQNCLERLVLRPLLPLFAHLGAVWGPLRPGGGAASARPASRPSRRRTGTQSRYGLQQAVLRWLDWINTKDGGACQGVEAVYNNNNVKKIRMNVFLLARQMKRLEEESRKTGSSVAELIRRAIDVMYPEEEKKKE